MGEFQITQIIDHKTCKVYPGWRWKNTTGEYIELSLVQNYAHLSSVQPLSLRSLSQNFFGKTVKLGQAQKVKRGKLVCEVFCDKK